MAWISVHQQVKGPKLRKLAKHIGCSQAEALGMLNWLWLWGMDNITGDGYIIGADKEDLSDILNVCIDKRYDAYSAIESMIETHWIDDEDGKLYFHDWGEWQEAYTKLMNFRKKEAERKREDRKKKREKLQEEKNTPSGEEMEEDLPEPKLNIPPVEEKKSKSEGYTTEFENFWKIYPRKVGKGEAYKKYKARLNDGWRPEELFEAAQNYASKVRREQTEDKYIKHAKTFLSDATPFKDYLDSKETQALSNNDDDDPFAEWRN